MWILFGTSNDRSSATRFVNLSRSVFVMRAHRAGFCHLHCSLDDRHTFWPM